MFAFNIEPMYSDVPQQFIRSAATASLKATCDMFSISTVIFIAVAIFTSFALIGISKPIWSFINLVQTIAYLRFFVDWPANTNLTFECFENAITGLSVTDLFWKLFAVFVTGVN